MKIYSPVKNFTGIRYNVRFVRGVGETDNPTAIEWFRSHGYNVPLGEIDIVDEPVNELVAVTDEPDFDSMTPNELRDWAKANGLGGVIKNTRNKEKLLELIRGWENG